MLAARRALYLVVSGAVAVAPHATPQSGDRTAPATVVTVHGVAYDSLANTTLREAFVAIVGTGRSATTDSRGRFQFDSVVPGTYTFTMQHAAIDSIGLYGASTRVTIAEGRTEVVIAIPSFATLWRAACGGGPPSKDSGFVYGSVLDATGRHPVAGATIDLSWLQISVDSTNAISQHRWRSRARSDSSGTYGVCGVPTTVGLRVQATTDSAASGLIDLPPHDARVQRRDLLVGPVRGDSTRRGTIAGAVTDGAGGAFRNARIVMDEVPETRTASDGSFVIRDVPAGTRQLEVQSVGMKPVMMAVNVAAGDTAIVAAQLEKVTTLDVVKVTASARQRRFIADFEQRRKSGFGYVLDSTEIGGRGTMGGALSGFPSANVEYQRGGRFTITLPGLSGSRCLAVLWIDGVKQVDYEELNDLHPDEVAAVEVYPRGFATPPQFVDPSGGPCGAVVVWTKWAFR